MWYPSEMIPLRSIWADKCGNALLTTALALPALIGAAGLGIHTMQMTLTKRQLQREADSAAISGAYSLYQGRGNAAAIASSTQALAQNDLVANVNSTLSPEPYTSSEGTVYSSTMFVHVSGTVPTPFMAILGYPSAAISAQARAAAVRAGKFCFLALENQVATGLRFQGNTHVDLDCGIGTNAKGASAVVATGSAMVAASPVAAMGAVAPSSNYEAGTELLSNHPEIADPFNGNAYQPSNSEVSNGACKINSSTWKTIAVASGYFATGTPGCYGTINVQGTLTLSSGTYFLANGANSAGLQVGSQGHLICDRCVFVLTSTTPNNQSSFATLTINGGATLELTPPDSGKYEGMTVYRDSRAAPSNQCCTINGNSSSTISGAFYFPKDNVSFNGTAGMEVSCFQMVAKRLSFSGDADVSNACDPPGGDNAWKLTKVRLIR